MSDQVTPIVFLDTETTGLHLDRRPWEIAMIRRDADGQREITLQVRDVDLSNAELIGLNIGRFYERHRLYNGLAEVEPGFACVTENVAAERVEEWTHGAHIVGAVPSFDTECLAAMLGRHNLTPAWHYHLVDVESMAFGWLSGWWREGRTKMPASVAEVLTPPWNSDALSLACGVEPPSGDERHTAMGDARWVMRWWDKLMGNADA